MHAIWHAGIKTAITQLCSLQFHCGVWLGLTTLSQAKLGIPPVYLDRNDLDNESLGGRNRKCEKNPGGLSSGRSRLGWLCKAVAGEKAAKTISKKKRALEEIFGFPRAR